MNEFEHERLDVYKAAIELLVLAAEVAATAMVKKSGSGSGSGSGST